ncbi:MFS transporter [Gallibacterium salpingitidis]|uniref:Arabinose ABC transporter permease n=1 Tax=Gallibacterium salpingitidis TaxID=505341 RepID=A0A1A7P1V3_9PAST|nr:MFS transporter [Gallibacterium salpingitidis]OBW95214.1 arabinose ABC transporter permease [Gallibacterium salpingitidis]
MIQNSRLLIFILAVGVFSIINTEMGVIGIIPLIAETFQVHITQAAWTVSVFALVIAVCAPILPLLCSGINRKTAMVVTLAVFTLSNLVATLTDNFTVLLIARIVPAFFQPIYTTIAFTVAANSVAPQQAPKAVANVFVGVSAGMVLGVPVTSFIANHFSFAMAMLFFTVVSGFVLLATVFLVPSMPVTQRSSFGSQLSVLTLPAVWYSILATVLINGSIFGFFSYIADFLNVVTKLSFDQISMILLLYGTANIIGNVLAGKFLAIKAKSTLLSVPILLASSYLLLYLFGTSALVTVIIVALLGILAGIAANSMQYMLTRAAIKAPEFANGLFLSCANLGTTVGTTICGWFLLSGTQHIVWGSLLLLAVSLLCVALRVRTISVDVVITSIKVNGNH